MSEILTETDLVFFLLTTKPRHKHGYYFYTLSLLSKKMMISDRNYTTIDSFLVEGFLYRQEWVIRTYGGYKMTLYKYNQFVDKYTPQMFKEL